MNKAGQGQLRRTGSSTDAFLSLINDYGFAALSQRNRQLKTVRSGADAPDPRHMQETEPFLLYRSVALRNLFKLKCALCAALVMHAKRSITNSKGANHIPILRPTRSFSKRQPKA